MTESELDSLNFDFDSFRDKNYLTHGFHPYPAKFVPQIPRALIQTLTKEDEIILDPFCGSGTTLVESKLLGRHSIGLDINPIAILSSTVKTTKLSVDQFKEITRVSEIVSSWTPHFQGFEPLEKPQDIPESNIPEFLNRDHWFKTHVQEELSIIRTAIIQTEDEITRNFLLLAFSSIITRMSNQDSETRYAFKEKKIQPGDSLLLFMKRVSEMSKQMILFNDEATECNVTVRNQDARNMSFLESESIQAIITSPPYLNTYDYYLYHRLRMYWLGFDTKKPQDLEIGSRNKHSDNKMSDAEYYDSMRDVFKECYRVLKESGFLSIVVGDAILRGEYIEMDVEFQKLARSFELELVKNISYPMSKYTRAFLRGKNRRKKLGHIMIFRKI